MNTTSKPKKTSLVKQAAWSAVLDAAFVLNNIVLLIKHQMTFTAEDYATLIPIPMLISLISLVLLVAIVILTFRQTKNPEREDELSKLNHFKAGYISKYICVLLFIIAVWVIKDFRFAFTGAFQADMDLFTYIMDNIYLPSIILGVALFVENITFIVLEKHGLE
ncbi:MAG: hypothetical protein IJZ82_01455 [Lachnospiraceae bacterium]|nr:hypothetical protein [Lachnospiraceae bacterium]